MFFANNPLHTLVHTSSFSLLAENDLKNNQYVSIRKFEHPSYVWKDIKSITQLLDFSFQ